LPVEEGGWQTFAPSALPLADGWPEPLAMTAGQINDLVDAFVRTAERARRLGFDYLELHCAHGYLLSTFLSPLSNRRDDEYGGSLENRMRLPLRIARELRQVWPADRPLGAKINGSDFVEGGWTDADAAALATELGEAGVDMVTVSGGGVDPAQKINVEAGYQVPFAERVRRESGVTTAAVGMIVTPKQAEEILAAEKADLVALARAMLFDPHWPRHAAVTLEADLPYPPQYERASPANWPGYKLMQGG
jgi:2,4-dienoyl-CoA reductase-like NADH-dependent reductase (Old Yellow Enzyme family)